MTWTKCEDGQPEVTQMCLVYSKQGEYILAYYSRVLGWHTQFGEGAKKLRPTHWMPVPEPPK